MPRRLALAFFLLLGGHSMAAENPDPTPPGPAAQAVRAFIERREACDHFRGEPVEGEGAQALARLEFVHRQVFENCNGTDAELARLRAAYADDPVVSRALAVFEYPIEVGGEVAGPPSDIDLAAEPTLQSGVYGALTLGVDAANGAFSGAYQTHEASCSLRLRGLLDRVGQPLRAIAQTRRDALADAQSQIGVVEARLVAGVDSRGKPTAWLRLDQLPDGCPELQALSAQVARPLAQTQSGTWISVHWIGAERAHFHGDAHPGTRRKAYVTRGDTLRGYAETAEFVELEFVAANGRATRGWVDWTDVLRSLSLGDGAEM